MATQKAIMRPSSNAPNSWPPILVATTNIRNGSRSASSNPQIVFCRATASRSSGSLASSRTSIKALPQSMLGLVPERLQLFDRRAVYLLALHSQAALHMSETLAEFGVGAAQRLFRIHLDEARYVDQHEQKVAQLVFDLVLGTALAGLREFEPFFFQLRQYFIRVTPIESHAGGSRSDLLRFHERRQRAGNAGQQALRSIRF